MTVPYRRMACVCDRPIAAPISHTEQHQIQAMGAPRPEHVEVDSTPTSGAQNRAAPRRGMNLALGGPAGGGDGGDGGEAALLARILDETITGPTVSPEGDPAPPVVSERTAPGPSSRGPRSRTEKTEEGPRGKEEALKKSVALLSVIIL
jgi:hypothetical protein